MKQEKAQRVLTNMGFDWGNMSIESCFETATHQCIRIRSMVTGSFIDVQMSKGGRRMFAYSRKQANNMKGFDPCGGKVKL